MFQDEKPEAYASKTLTKAETNYAQIEKEMLSIVFFSCKRFHQYIYGNCKVITVESDHKPISSIWKNSLCNASPSLQRMLLQLQKYYLNIVHVLGKDIPVGDLLSRKSLSATNPSYQQISICILTWCSHSAVSNQKIEQVKQAIRSDSHCQLLTDTILSDWPETRANCPAKIVDFWNHRDELSVGKDLIFRGQKLLIPLSLRQELIKAVHVGHMGVDKCLQRARDIMFWPKMSSDITDYVLKCDICLKHRNSNTKEPLKSHPIPDRP